MHILLVEDEHSLAHGIKLNLELEGYAVTHVSSGKTAIDVFNQNYFDLLILDIMLPEKNGFQVAEEIRKTSDVPIMIISAKNQSTDRIKGLKIGANDYLSKPFELEELLLRVKNLTSRYAEPKYSKININGFNIDMGSFVAETKQGEKRLSKKEIEVLKILFENSGKVVPREEILQKAWKNEADASARTIDNFIVNFRKYFEDNPKNPEYFVSIRGVGYIFKDKGN